MNIENEKRVIHVDAEPTGIQLETIVRLFRQLGTANPDLTGLTRLGASNLIGILKTQIPDEQPASSSQISYINTLMENRSMPLANRREARKRLDAGLTRAQASAWIKRLKELPEIAEPKITASSEKNLRSLRT
jgi:hypothetical protein